MTSEMSAAGRIYQWAGMFIVGVCLLLPLDTRFRKPHDDFPLSWYPMFASKRPDLESPVYAVAIWPDGHEAKITTGTWTTGGFNEGRTQLANAVKQGKEASERFCQRIVKGMRGRSSFKGAERVEIRIAKIRKEDWFLEEKVPEKVRVLRGCQVTE